MIKRVRSDFDKDNSSYKDEHGNDKAGSLKELLAEGFVELLGVTDPKSVSEISYSNGKPFSPVLYEYIWSVGIVGNEPKWCEKLDEEDSIVIQLIFHAKHSRFSIREIAADLKQLPPFQKKDKTISSWLEALRPAVYTVGKGLEAVPGLGGTGKFISTISETKTNTVSPEEFPWWTKTLCTQNEAGIEWHVSRSYLQSVGGRFVGTLGAYFIDCNSSSNTESENKISIEIRAFLKGPEKRRVSEELFISPTNKETSLVIKPRSRKEEG